MLFVRILLENTNVNAKMDTMVTAGFVQVSLLNEKNLFLTLKLASNIN